LKITYLGKSAFIISSGINIVFNPGTRVPEDKFSESGLIIITNSSRASIGSSIELSNVSKSWIISNDNIISKLEEKGAKSWLLRKIDPDSPYEISDIEITSKILMRGGSREIENLGILLNMESTKIGYLGDTCTRGTFENIDIDILIIPIGGGNVFDVKDAISLTVDISPKIVIPFGGNNDDNERFVRYMRQFCEQSDPVILKVGQTINTSWPGGSEFKFEHVE